MHTFSKFISVLIFCLFLFGVSESNAQHTKLKKHCENCPEMISVMGGDFLIGSSDFQDDEQPVKKIKIAAFMVSRFEITVSQYSKFIDEVGFQEQSPCLVMGENGSWYQNNEASWDNPGFEQGPTHPVVCISWQASKAFVKWLNTKIDDTQPQFRLLSESEWEYVAKAGTQTTYWWGNNEEDFCQYTNGADAVAFEQYPQWIKAGKCSDGHLYTAPVGFYEKPNKFGAEDMIGNVWEWVEDCYKDGYSALANNGDPQQMSPCEKRVFRGGAWGDYGSFYLRSTYRGAWPSGGAFSNVGLRIARSAVSTANLQAK